MLDISFCQFANNLYYILKYFVDSQILYLCIHNKRKFNSLGTCYENMSASG